MKRRETGREGGARRVNGMRVTVSTVQSGVKPFVPGMRFIGRSLTVYSFHLPTERREHSTKRDVRPLDGILRG